MILQYIPWFALGISVYLLLHLRKTGVWQPAARTAALAITTLLVCESVAVALLAVAFASAVFLAASGQLSLLRFGPFVWFGTISYPLYLVHENIGWAVMLRLLSVNVPMDIAIILTLAAILLLAGGLTHWVEQPAMRWIRTRYRNTVNMRPT
jgi:peptidoglycan/LPS O-acetylase OafA/YrhL